MIFSFHCLHWFFILGQLSFSLIGCSCGVGVIDALSCGVLETYSFILSIKSCGRDFAQIFLNLCTVTHITVISSISCIQCCYTIWSSHCLSAKRSYSELELEFDYLFVFVCFFLWTNHPLILSPCSRSTLEMYLSSNYSG